MSAEPYAVYLRSWMDDAPPPRPAWPPRAPLAPTLAAPAAPPRRDPPPAPAAPAAPPPGDRDHAIAVHADGDELVVLVGALGEVDHRTHLRAQDAALEAARVALAVVPSKDRGALKMVATKDHVIVRVACRSALAQAVDVARGVLAGWKAGAL